MLTGCPSAERARFLQSIISGPPANKVISTIDLSVDAKDDIQKAIDASLKESTPPVTNKEIHCNLTSKIIGYHIFYVFFFIYLYV